MTIPPDEIIYMEKAARDRHLFFKATGSTYAQQLNKWRLQYLVRQRKSDFDTWLQRRLAFIRRVAL